MFARCKILCELKNLLSFHKKYKIKYENNLELLCIQFVRAIWKVEIERGSEKI